ncbi:MAG: SusC/RagA family TonB-linked outer membrane protein [Clostridium sp.]|nr:SusC/RagA family TonB-linked outer membrane protein [Bacteroides sp.]MCM1198507.1 SusC/RagA family TonB-linked outer membrane protein [Clostridium sp.]
MNKNRLLKILLAAAVLMTAGYGSASAEPYRGGYPDSEFSGSGQQGKEYVKGTVKSDTGEPLAGAMVYIKGTTVGVQTDLDGNYSIEAPKDTEKGYTLVFQYLGMVTKEIPVKKTRLLNVILEQDNELESSVIVGAYGSKQRREDLVGSAFQVSSEQLKDKPKSRIDNILDGLVPGMSVQPNADYAGTTRTRYETRVRGSGSLSASCEPIWIVDGVRMYTGGNTNIMPGMSYTVSPLSYLDVDDIESITVLKDADQTTIYGADGANGVILVTTNRGKKNTPLRVNATFRFGVSAPDYSTMFKTMDASQYLEVAKEAWSNAGYDMSTFPYQDNDYNSYSTTDTDWARQYLGIGTDLYARIGLSNGTDKVANSLSASYYRNTNIVQKDNQQRFNITATEDFTLWKGAFLNTNFSASYNVNELFPLSKYYISCLPIFSPYLEDGMTYRLYNKIFDDTKGDFYMKKFFGNELPERDYNDNGQRTLYTSGNFNFGWEIIKGLSINSRFGINYQHSHSEEYSSMNTLDGIDSAGNRTGSSARADASYIHWTNTNTLNYDNRFGRHHVGAMAGVELYHGKNRYLSMSGSGFTNDSVKELAYATTISQSSYSNISTSRELSYFARAEYSYDSRYYIAANFRNDGNSVFGEYSRWAPFGSVGISWNIHNEKFFRSKKISMLKLKASFGSAGNSRIDADAEGTYSYSSSYSYNQVAGAVLGSVPNPSLTWETSYILNAGVRLELNDILDIEIEGYNKYTVDLLGKTYVSRTITDERVQANIGKMRNSGVDMNLTTYNFNRRDFKWTTTLNMSHDTNRILALNNGIPTSFGTTVWMEGHDRNTFYLVRWAGVDPADGMPMWYDRNGNVTKTYSQDDRIADKTATPILYGAIMNSLSYRNWSLSFQINYNIGGYALATYALNYFNDGYDITGGNQAVETYYYRWTTPGQAATFPKVSQVSTKSGMSSTRFLYNTTYFTLQNLSLTYRIPDKVTSRLRIRGASVSLIGDNLYLLTPDQKKGMNSYKTMKNGYPVTRTFSLNLTANF